MRAALALLAALVLAMAPAGQASGQDDGEALVWWPMVTDGTEYRRISYPEQAGEIVVLADTTVVLEARRARVAYWPITREYVPEIASSGQLAEGTVEVVAEDGTVLPTPPQPYILWYPDGVGAGPSELVTGDAAAETHARYVADARSAAVQAQEYERVAAAHQAAVEAWLRMAAERRTDMPPPPPDLDLPLPVPYRAYASEPANATLATLAPGRYTIRLRDTEGAAVEGSERTLVSLAPSARGTGYVVRPQDRWTQPILSLSPRDTIYTRGRTDLFLQPVPVLRYDARSYARLFQPQSVEIADVSEAVWIPAEATGDAADRLALEGGNERSEVPIEGYRVAQLPGRSRGYAIEPFAPLPGQPLRPDFQAMRVPAETDAGGLAVISADCVAAGSARPLRRVEPLATAWLFLPALLPLAAGAATPALRKQRRRLARPAEGAARA